MPPHTVSLLPLDALTNAVGKGEVEQTTSNAQVRTRPYLNVDGFIESFKSQHNTLLFVSVVLL